MAQDGLDELASQIRRYLEFARRIVRRWWLICILTFLGAGGSVVAALAMTRYYESRTLISHKESVDKTRVFSNEENRREANWLRMRLEETLSSHTLRMKVIRELDLFPKMRDAVAPEVLLEEFRRKVKYDMVGSDSFWIAFEYKDPRKAQQGAARLADEFIRKYIHDKLYAAQATLTFMNREVKKARNDMETIESQMAQFVSDHPEYKIDPTTGMSTGMASVTVPSGGRRNYASGVSDPELRRLLSQKGQLEARLAVTRNPKSDPKVVQARQQFERARARLLTLRRQYTDRHPDVQRARNYARQMQMQLNIVMSSSKGTNTNQSAQIRAEIAALDDRIASRTRRLRRRVRRSAVPAAPAPKRSLTRKAQLEKRFYQLTRDREVTKAKLEQLNQQLLRSRMSADIERKQAETEFAVVDKANLPRKPSRPSRTKLAMAGTAAGLMLGFALSVLLVIFDPRVYSEDDLRKSCDLPVLAQIPKEA